MPNLDPRAAIADHLIKPLREGKPELGWEGDDQLMLVFARIEQRWELWRHDPATGKDVPMFAAPPGRELNEDAINQLIRWLVDGDTHRRGNSSEEILRRALEHNEKLIKDREDKTVDMMAEKLGEFYHEAGKAYGLPRTQFGYGT